jgi:hypothetical protein
MGETHGVEQQAEVPPLPTDIIPEPDAIAAAMKIVEQLKAKRAALLDRIDVNRSSARTRAFAALTDGGRARQELDDWDAEVAALERELGHLDAALAEGERRHQAALSDQKAAEERRRAEEARERFNEFGRIAQQFSDAIDAVVQLYGELREAAAALRATGFGPAEAQITRWGQRLVVFRCQHDRLLRFEDLMVDANEKRWLVSAPKDWLTKLQADTARVLEPPAQAAE